MIRTMSTLLLPPSMVLFLAAVLIHQGGVDSFVARSQWGEMENLAVHHCALRYDNFVCSHC